MNIRVVRCHMATIGYEDSNPFSLCDWIVEVAGEGYTSVVEAEFTRCFVRPEDMEDIPRNIYQKGSDVILIDEIYDKYDIETLQSLEYDMEVLEKCDTIIILAPLNSGYKLEGDVRVTMVEK